MLNFSENECRNISWVKLSLIIQVVLGLICLKLECGDLLYLGAYLSSLSFLWDSNFKVGITDRVFNLQAVILSLIH